MESHIPIHTFSLLIHQFSLGYCSSFWMVLFIFSIFQPIFPSSIDVTVSPVCPSEKKHADGSHLPMDKGPASEHRTGNPWLRDPASHICLTLCCPSPGSLPSSSKGSTIISEVEMLTHIFKILCIRFQLLWMPFPNLCPLCATYFLIKYMVNINKSIV